MPCKLDSTENLRSFDKYPTPPSKSQKIKNEGFAVPSRDKDRCLSQNSNLENLDCLQMLYKRRCGREGPDRCVAGRGFYWAACYSEGGGGGEEQLGKQGQEMEETVRVSGSKRHRRTSVGGGGPGVEGEREEGGKATHSMNLSCNNEYSNLNDTQTFNPGKSNIPYTYT